MLRCFDFVIFVFITLTTTEYLLALHGNHPSENNVGAKFAYGGFRFTNQYLTSFVIVTNELESLQEFGLLESEFLQTYVVHFNQENCSIVISDRIKEFTDSDIYNTISSGYLKHTSQSQFVYINAKTVEATKYLLRVSIQHKIVRRHRDIFIVSNQSKNLTNTYPFTDIKHIYYFTSPCKGVSRIKDLFHDLLRNISLKYTKQINGKHLEFVCVIGEPKIKIFASEYGKILSATGSQYNLLLEASEQLNFTFTLRHSKDGSAGRSINGTWYGAVGEVFKREADVAIGCGITATRNTIVEGGVPLSVVNRVFYVKQEPSYTNWKALFNSFELLVWILLFTITVLVTLTYILLRKFKFGKTFLCSENTSYSVLTIFGILLEQSLNTKYWFGFRVKSIVFLWIVFALILQGGYKSRLFYFLTFISPSEMPRTHNELVKENYKMYFRYYGGVAYRYAQHSKDLIQRVIANRAILINSSQECIILSIISEKSACLDWDSHGSYAVYSNATIHFHQSEPLVLKSIDSVISNVLVPWNFRKHSPLTETFDNLFVNIISSGILSYWEYNDVAEMKREGMKWLNSKPGTRVGNKIIKTFNEFQILTKGLTMNSLVGIFIGLVIGICIGIIVLIGETFDILKSMLRKFRF